MIQTPSGNRLILSDSKITEAISGNTSINKKIMSWDLNKLELMVTSDTLEDDRKRKEIERKKRRNSNMLTGAVLGGFIDGSQGDDSIVDGVLLGAAFGALTTSSAGEAKAKIGLIFSDNESLTLEVNGDEYNHLQTVAQKNLKKGEFPSGASVQSSLLSKGDVEYILKERSMSNFMKSLVFAVLAVISFSFMGSFLSSSQNAPAVDSHAGQLAVEFSEMAQFLPYIGIFICGIVLFAGVASLSSLKQRVREDEKERYEELFPEKQAAEGGH